MFKNKQFIYNCGGDRCRTNVFAYVFPTDSDHNVYLCEAYFRATQSRGWDSTPGTVIHESTHFNDVLGT